MFARKRKNITIVCDGLDEKAARRRLRKLGARDIEKKTTLDEEENRTVTLRADVLDGKFNSKKSDKLYRLADSVNKTVEA